MIGRIQAALRGWFDQIRPEKETTRKDEIAGLRGPSGPCRMGREPPS